MKNGIKIVIVEDDPSIQFGLKEVFAGEGYETAVCGRGDEAEQLIGAELPDLIILDVMLPGKNGYEICKNLRERKCRIPILMLTAKGQEIDKVVGLDCGADDYVTKPFGVQELVARVRALLRRCERSPDEGGGEKQPARTFKVGLAEIDEKKYEIYRDGESGRLTPKEMELLKFFYQHRGEVMSRDKILDAVWGIQYYGTTRTLDQCVAQLRRKIGDAGSSPQYLKTVHGVGYCLEEGED
ncbi:MAG: response regulator transcription factor [Verrucomicrobiota bacterium]